MISAFRGWGIWRVRGGTPGGLGGQLGHPAQGEGGVALFLSFYFFFIYYFLFYFSYTYFSFYKNTKQTPKVLL